MLRDKKTGKFTRSEEDIKNAFNRAENIRKKIANYSKDPIKKETVQYKKAVAVINKSLFASKGTEGTPSFKTTKKALSKLNAEQWKLFNNELRKVEQYIGSKTKKNNILTTELKEAKKIAAEFNIDIKEALKVREILRQNERTISRLDQEPDDIDDLPGGGRVIEQLTKEQALKIVRGFDKLTDNQIQDAKAIFGSDQVIPLIKVNNFDGNKFDEVLALAAGETIKNERAALEYIKGNISREEYLGLI